MNDITFSEYQLQAKRTVQWKTHDAEIVPLLGLAGETGQLLTQVKKRLRDGDNFLPFHDFVSEELVIFFGTSLQSHRTTT